MSFDLNNHKIKDKIFSACFGLEKECLRVDENGFLAHTDHGFDDEHLQRDFCENQVEFVTDAFDNIKDVCAQLTQLHKTVQKNLAVRKSGREFLWSFSNPPYVKGENDVPIANFVGTWANKSVYRKYLAEKYGRLKMLYSGIHFNFSFNNELIESAFESSGKSDFCSFKNDIYLELAQKSVQYAWLIVYLTAASPVIDCSFINADKIGETVVTYYSSARCSEAGYWNTFVPTLKYGSTEEYVQSIQKYIDEGRLKSASELYYPIRLKPQGENTLENLHIRGVNHIEFRMFDVNPLSPIGILEDDIKFVHCLIVYLMSQPKITLSDDEQITAINNEKMAARLDDEQTIEFLGDKRSIKSTALDELCKIRKFYENFGDDEILKIIDKQIDKIKYPDKRYANIVKKEYGKNYVKNGLKLAEKYQNELIDT